MAEYLSKPGREAHTLLDKGFFYGLRALSKLFDKKNFKYALYGGSSLQAQFAKYFAGNKSIDKIKGLEAYFRPTSDFDFAIPSGIENDKIMQIMSELPKEEIFDNELYFTKLERNGSKRPMFSVARTTNHNEDITNIWLNFTSSDALDGIMDERENIHLVYAPLAIDVYVTPIELTLAGKLMRSSIPRDIPDLLKAFQTFDNIDVEKIYSLIKKKQKNEPYAEMPLQIVRKGKEAILDYLLRHQEKN